MKKDTKYFSTPFSIVQQKIPVIYVRDYMFLKQCDFIKDNLWYDVLLS